MHIHTIIRKYHKVIYSEMGGGAFSTPFPVKIKTLIAYENKLTPPPPNQAKKKSETIFIRFLSHQNLQQQKHR